MDAIIPSKNKPDWVVEPDDPFGKEIGFTSDKFMGYLSKIGNDIYISHIESRTPGKGNLSKLFNSLWNRGYKIHVPTPFPRMEAICKRKGFKHHIEKDPYMGEVEVWSK